MKSTHASDETNLTEIEILTDGRILLFGASREVLDVLDAVQLGRDPGVQSRLIQAGGQSSSANATNPTTDPRGRCP